MVTYTPVNKSSTPPLQIGSSHYQEVQSQKDSYFLHGALIHTQKLTNKLVIRVQLKSYVKSIQVYQKSKHIHTLIISIAIDKHMSLHLTCVVQMYPSHVTFLTQAT